MNFIPVNEPLLEGNEKKYLNECIDTGWISSDGPFVERFEKEFSSKVGRKYGIAVSNGTSAIDIAVQSLEIGIGDEVILPAFTIISTILQIVRSGAKPVLVDSDPFTWNMNVDQIEEKITSNTKAGMTEWFQNAYNSVAGKTTTKTDKNNTKPVTQHGNQQ